MVGIIQAQSVHLSLIANHIPDATDAVARVAKVRRWLKNAHLDTQAVYEPIITHVLQAWAHRDVIIILDGCFVYGDRLQLQRLSLSHGFRALPLAWTVVQSKGLVALDVCAHAPACGQTPQTHAARDLARRPGVSWVRLGAHVP